MHIWEYLKICRVLDLSHVDPLSFNKREPTYIWEDILDQADATRNLSEMKRLEQLGIDGWEIASILHEEVDKKSTYTYYLKRLIE